MVMSISVNEILPDMRKAKADSFGGESPPLFFTEFLSNRRSQSSFAYAVTVSAVFLSIWSMLDLRF